MKSILNLEKLIKFLFVFGLITISIGCDSDSSDEPKADNRILGGWYNEEYQEYDKYVESGVYYSEFPNPVGSGNFFITGNYTFEDNILTLMFEYDGVNFTTSNEVVSLTDYEMIYKDVETGDEYRYIKVVDELVLDMGESVLLSSIAKDFTVYGYTVTQGVAFLDEDKLTGFIEGTGFLKLSTDKGDVMVKITVVNEQSKLIPDFSFAIGKSRGEIGTIFGTPYMDEDLYMYYTYNSPLVSSAMFSLEPTSEGSNFNDKVTAVMITLSEENDLDKVLDYLKSIYTLFSDNNGSYMFMNNDATLYLSFVPDSRTLVFVVF